MSLRRHQEATLRRGGTLFHVAFCETAYLTAAVRDPRHVCCMTYDDDSLRRGAARYEALKSCCGRFSPETVVVRMRTVRKTTGEYKERRSTRERERRIEHTAAGPRNFWNAHKRIEFRSGSGCCCCCAWCRRFEIGSRQQSTSEIDVHFLVAFTGGHTYTHRRWTHREKGRPREAL